MYYFNKSISNKEGHIFIEGQCMDFRENNKQYQIKIVLSSKNVSGLIENNKQQANMKECFNHNSQHLRGCPQWESSIEFFKILFKDNTGGQGGGPILDIIIKYRNIDRDNDHVRFLLFMLEVDPQKGVQAAKFQKELKFDDQNIKALEYKKCED